MQVVGDIRSAQPIRFSITPYSSDASPPPFTITPQVGRVPAHGTATFTIAATPENPPELGTGEPGSGPCYARFVADATWVLADGSAPGRGPGDSSVTVEELPSQATVGTAGAATATASRRASNAASAAPSGVEGGPSAVTAATAATETTEDLGGAGPAGTVSRACLVLRTHITPIEPVLHVDKRKPSGKKDKLPFVKFGVWSTHPGSHPSHNRQITLTNQIPTALTFTLAVEGPFTMLNARTHAPKHPLQSREGAVVNRPLSAGSTRMFTLPHLANVVVDLQFDKGLARSQYHPVANPLDTSMSRRKDGLDTQRAKDAKAATKGPLAHLARTPSVLDDAKGKLKTECVARRAMPVDVCACVPCRVAHIRCPRVSWLCLAGTVAQSSSRTPTATCSASGCGARSCVPCLPRRRLWSRSATCTWKGTLVRQCTLPTRPPWTQSGASDTCRFRRPNHASRSTPLRLAWRRAMDRSRWRRWA